MKNQSSVADAAPKKRGRPRKLALRTKATRPSGLHLTPINGSMFFDQYGRVLHESEGEDRTMDLRPIGLWNARDQKVEQGHVQQHETVEVFLIGLA